MGHTDFNIVAYTSVIPAEATEVKYEDVKHTFHHGAVTCFLASLAGCVIAKYFMAL